MATDVGRNETVRLDDESRASVFENHSAFARVSFVYIDHDLPVGHLASHDTSITTMPTPFDRTNHDDVDRSQDDVLAQLAGEVDQHCLDVLLASPAVPVVDVAPADVDEWTRASILEVKLDTRSGCGVDVVFDTELSPLITTKEDDGPRYVDLGWRQSNVYSMSRHQPVERGFYVVVNLQHVIGLSSRVSLFLTSQSLDEASEFLSARCELAYRPRLDFHPGAVRIARVTFADEDAWRTALRSAATLPRLREEG